MRDNDMQNANKNELLKTITIKHNQELSAAGSLTSETLSRLNLTIESLPPHCQQLINNIAITQKEISTDQIDLPTILYLQTTEKSKKFDDEYEILKLRQKNEELQAKIDRNNAFLQVMRQELANSRDALKKGNPNVDNIQEFIRQMKQKVVSYEESYEKAKSKYLKLQIPEQIMPKQLIALAATLAQLQEEESKLRAQAEDISLARQARQNLHMLRR